MTITSAQNPQLKEIRRLHRRRSRKRAGRFVAEGEDLLAAADAAGWPALERFVAAGSGLAGTEVEREALDEVSALGSGTRALAVYEQRWSKPTGPRCVALWGVGDPGNVGTVLRSAAAFSAATVALGPACADVYSPKAVRASMGAVFAVPLARVESVDELPGTTIALVGGKGARLDEAVAESCAAGGCGAGAAGGPGVGAASEPGASAVSLVVGAERAGLPDDVVAACDRVAHIPIVTDSLNAAMAATIGLYELGRRMAAA